MNMPISHPPLAAFVDDFMALWPEVGPMLQHNLATAAKTAPKASPISLFHRPHLQRKKLADRA